MRVSQPLKLPVWITTLAFLLCSFAQAQNCTFYPSDQITRVLLNKLRVSSLQPLPDNTGASPQAIATPLELKVLPEQFSGIYTPEVAAKSPSAGAKGIGFWAGVGEWFADAANATGTWVVNTADSVRKDPAQVAWFSLGFVPVLGGAIDCARGYYNFFTSQDVDLLETEMGCVGMSLDAVMVAGGIVSACATCPAYLANKAIIISLKTMNRISKTLDGATRTALKKMFERLRNAPILRYPEEAKKLITRVENAKFAKGVIDEGGEAG
jgi:hypothetical protein